MCRTNKLLGSVTMASSNLKAKLIDRTTLYYNKYEYRVVVKSPHMFYTWFCDNIDDFRNAITDACNEYDKHENKTYYWRRGRPNVEDWEYELIENLLNLIQKHKPKKQLTVRKENQTCCIYTSDVKIVKKILSFYPDAEINQVSLMPTGVMTFKREPPAKYRAYTTNSKMPIGFKEEFIEYLNRTPDIKPSDSFYAYLHRTNRVYQPWLWDKYYIDYDDDKNLMMIMLMFPGLIGKKYKLEKK